MIVSEFEIELCFLAIRGSLHKHEFVDASSIQFGAEIFPRKVATHHVPAGWPVVQPTHPRRISLPNMDMGIDDLNFGQVRYTPQYLSPFTPFCF